MPRIGRFTLLLVAIPAVLALGAGPVAARVGAATAFADDGPAPKPGEKAGDPDGPKNATAGKVNATTATRQERAQRLVKELETTILILRSAGTADADTLQSLERALAEARALAKPITASELTEAERTALAEELAAQDGGKGGPKGDDEKDGEKGPGDDWRERALAGAFKDAGLNEDEQIAAQKIIADWFDKSRAAQFAGESKRVSDLKQARNEALEKTLGRKKAQKVINNLNSMSGRGR